MLETMRRAARSWVAKLLIVLLIASFAVWGIGDIFTAQSASTIARVGGTEISAERFADAMLRQQQRLSRAAGRAVTIAEMQALGVDRQVLAALVRDATFAEELGRLDLAVPDEAVAEAIRGNPAFQDAQGNFAVASYELLLREQGFRAPEFEALTREVLGQDLIAASVRSRARTAPGVAARIAAHLGEERRVRLLVLPHEQAEAPTVPDDAALEAFLAAEAERFTEPERRDVRYLHVDPAAIAASLEIPDEEIAEAYASRIDAYRMAPTRTIDQLTFPSFEAAAGAAARMAAGGIDYDGLAAELGQAGAMALGEVGEEELPSAVSAAVFAAKDPGVLAPIETAVGAVLIRVKALTPEVVLPLEVVAETLRAELARERAVDRAIDIGNAVEEQRAAGAELAEIAAATGATYGTVELLGRDGTLAGGQSATGVAQTQSFLEEVFAALEREERSMIETEDGGYILVEVERIVRSSLPSLGEIRARVETAWLLEQRLTVLEAEARNIAARIGAGETTLADVASGRGLPLASPPPFPRNAPAETVPVTMVSEIFALPTGHAAVGRPAGGGGVVIAEISDVVAIDAEGLAELAGTVEQQFDESLEADLVEHFARALEREFGAEIDQSALASILARVGGGGGV